MSTSVAAKPAFAPTALKADPKSAKALEIKELFYDPAVVLMGDTQKQYLMAAGLFLQGMNQAKKHGLTDEVTKYNKFYSLAMNEAKRTDELASAKSASGGGGGGGGGKSDEDKPVEFKETPLFNKDSSPIRTFKSLSGMAAEKKDIERLFLLPNNFPNMFTSGKGLLFYGPPGTGKTYIIPAVAYEMLESLGGVEKADIHLDIVSPAHIKGRYVGDTERNLQLLWEQADRVGKPSAGKKYGKSIIFMDEVDGLSGKRSTGDANMTTSVNMMLQLLDGVVRYDNVIFMAATNFPWSIDPAILRRFTMKIFLDLPGRAAITSMIYYGCLKNVHEQT